MSGKVFANNREVAGKATSGKVVAAMPDVCFTPPDKIPATPPGVPIPYPNTGRASDTNKGSKSVKVRGKEVVLKNKSNFKKSYGDEAGCAQKKGIITSKNRGKVYFQSWSMDVKFEGKNATRHLDMTTNNHASQPGDTPPWPYVDSQASDGSNSDSPCSKDQKKEQKACGGLVARRANKNGPGAILKGDTKKNICADTAEAKKCREAQKCKLTPQKEGCCPNKELQAHHLVEAHGFIEAGTRDNLKAKALPEFKGYQPGDAPCVCAEGGRSEKEHGAFHALVGKKENSAIRRASSTGGNPAKAWTYKDAKKAGANAHKKIFPKSACSPGCIEAQLDAYHNKVGATDSSPVRTDNASLSDWQKQSDSAILNDMADQLRKDQGNLQTL